MAAKPLNASQQAAVDQAQIEDAMGAELLIDKNPEWDQAGSNQSWNAFAEMFHWFKHKLRKKKDA